MHAISSYRGNRPTPHTHKQKRTHTATNRQYRLQYTAPQLARSVTIKKIINPNDTDGVSPKSSPDVSLCFDSYVAFDVLCHERLSHDTWALVLPRLDYCKAKHENLCVLLLFDVEQRVWNGQVTDQREKRFTQPGSPRCGCFVVSGNGLESLDHHHHHHHIYFSAEH